MTDLSPDQVKALQIAHNLVDAGVPIFSAPPHSSQEFALPDSWQTYRPNHIQVERWRPGWCLAMVCGVVFDVLDVDPRNGGLEGFQELLDAHAVPTILGAAGTPSDGRHYLIARTHLAKTSKAARGVDLQAGADDGSGRGFIYIAPTVRISKFGPNEGQRVAYEWITEPHVGCGPVGDVGLDNLVAVVNTNRGPRRAVATKPATKQVDDDLAAFADFAEDWTAESAHRVIDEQCRAVRDARAGEINSTLGGAARMFGRFMAGGFLDEESATRLLVAALEIGGVHSDAWNLRNGKGWTAATVIGAGLANGAQEPWTVEAPAASSTAGAPLPPRESGTDGPRNAPGRESEGGVEASGATVAAPRLLVTSPADMTYWLQNALGTGNLSGYFLRAGQVAHTPRVDEAGYVAPQDVEDENGPVQIQAVTAPQLAAKIQYAYACYKEVDEKDADGKKTGEKREVPALFPLEAAKRATDAPEAMVMLRGLAGITHTPMVRADGSILDRPGYDPTTRMLFLPGPGVNVPAVPEAPKEHDIEDAVKTLESMTEGFPWDTDDDRANYIGMLLTPLLRLVTPPAYKMFGITAHQPGSGKTLLADVARIIHGGVLRSEMPEDEAEIGKMTTAVLATTSAPVVHVDNVSGVLRSGKLAGILTADGALQDRELGASRMLTFTNDRLWVVTGNNLSLGGDLVRRTVVINIDPNMANPETREFAIADLKGWARQNRSRLLWALLVMVRAWVAAGSPEAPRKQSDSFARWEASVAGILGVCGVPGAFDAESGKKAAGGGDDDGLADVLERIWQMRQSAPWVVAEILSDTVHTPEGDFVAESREWLPSPVLDKLARSEAAGRKTMGYWLRNRLGRWVSGSDGHGYVIRGGEKGRAGVAWSVERSE